MSVTKTDELEIGIRGRQLLQPLLSRLVITRSSADIQENAALLLVGGCTPSAMLYARLAWAESGTPSDLHRRSQ